MMTGGHFGCLSNEWMVEVRVVTVTGDIMLTHDRAVCQALKVLVFNQRSEKEVLPLSL